MRRSRVAFAIVALALAGAAVGWLLVACADRRRPPSLILFTLDTTRADRLGCYGNREARESPTPFADSLAAEGVLFERCFAPRGETHPSLASLLTGKYPATHGLRENGGSLDSSHVPFPVLLQRAGYATAAFVSNLDRTRWPFWLRGFDVAKDGVDGRLVAEGGEAQCTTQRTWDERVERAATEWIETRSADQGPFFLWVHLYDVHDPYTPPEEVLARFRDPAYAGPIRDALGPDDSAPRDRVSEHLRAWTLHDAEPTDADLRQVRALYDAGLFIADARLQRIHDALARRGLLDGAVVVVTADHGEELADHHRYFGHGASIYDSVLRVPLIATSPGRFPAGRRSNALAQLVDLFPTFLDLARTEPRADAEGFDLVPLLDGAAERTERRHVFAEWEDLVLSASDGEWKLIANPTGARPRKPPYHLRPGVGFPLECFELYRIADDPREQVNRYAKDDPHAIELGRVIDGFRRDPRHARTMTARSGVDPGLAAIGYAGGGRDDVLHVDCGEKK